jgi:hypothetical protein
MKGQSSAPVTSSIRGVSSRWLGAVQDLGIRVEWRAAFVGAGQRVTSAPDTVAIDVGGDLAPGVIDHHAGLPAACSAAALVVERPDLVHSHLVGPWIEESRHRDIRGLPWQPTIVTHRAPDFDSIAGIAIVRRLVEHGDLPDWCHALAGYATEVDQGRELLSIDSGRRELYPLVLTLSVLGSDELMEVARIAGGIELDSEDAARLSVGLELVRLWADPVACGGPMVPAGAARRRLPADHPIVARLDEELGRDLDRFCLARDEGHVRLLPGDGLVSVPARDGDTTVRLRAAVSASADRRHRSSCGKHFLRSGAALPHRAQLTVMRGTAAPGRHRWIISVDPGGDVAGGPGCLRGLGVSLEAEEQRRRGGFDGAGNAARRGATRFEFAPGIADPWYDGRGHLLTIVDSPRDGSVLEEADVLRVLRSRFWEPEVAACELVIWRDAADGPIPSHAEAECGGRARLGEAVEHAIDRGGSLGASNVLLAVACSERWGLDPIRQAARRVAGVGARELEFDGIRIFVGPHGVLLQASGGAIPSVRSDVRAELDRVERILRHMRRMDREIAAGQVRGTSDVRTAHVREVSRYHGSGHQSSPEGSRVAAVLAEVHSLEERIRGIGELLSRLDDMDERARGTQLNLIVIVLGLAGMLQAAAAVVELAGWHEAYPWVVTVLLVVSGVMFVGAAVAAFGRGRMWLLGIPWIRGLVGAG